MELGWGKRWLEERFEEGGDAGGVHGEPGEILAGAIAKVQFLSGGSQFPVLSRGERSAPSVRLLGHQRGAAMGDAPQVNLTIQKILELASRCAQAETSDNYGALGDQVEELEGRAREVFQSKMDLASLLPILKAGKPLTSAGLKTLELLIVGDAEYFLKYETEFDRWKSEIKQLVGEISKLQSADLDVDGLMHLRALCGEVRRVLPAVVYYLDQKERTSKFHEATQGQIDAEGYRTLAEIVAAMLSSDKM